MSNKQPGKEKLSHTEVSPDSGSNTNMERENNKEESSIFNSAELNIRALAFFIDIVIVLMLAFVAFGIGIYFLQGTEAELGSASFTIYLLLFILASSYFVILNGYSGKTIGKMLMGIRIISDDGNTIGFWQSFVRWIGYYISAIFLFVGFLWSIFDRNSQSWHDKIAGTFVVKD